MGRKFAPFSGVWSFSLTFAVHITRRTDYFFYLFGETSAPFPCHSLISFLNDLFSKCIVLWTNIVQMEMLNCLIFQHTCFLICISLTSCLQMSHSELMAFVVRYEVSQLSQRKQPSLPTKQEASERNVTVCEAISTSSRICSHLLT